MDIESMSLDELIATQNDEPPLCEPFGFTCDYVIDELDRFHARHLLKVIENFINDESKSSIFIDDSWYRKIQWQGLNIKDNYNILFKTT
jgi:hypothetical protein